jgi:hypothetical protein
VSVCFSKCLSAPFSNILTNNQIFIKLVMDAMSLEVTTPAPILDNTNVAVRPIIVVETRTVSPNTGFRNCVQRLNFEEQDYLP